MHSKPRNISALLILVSASVNAEVTIDGSLGGAAFDAVISGNGFTYDIQDTYGQSVGTNLFHSFDKFNIGIDEHANFSGTNTIANIIARVTGGESSIAGRITSSIDGSSLYMVNSAGFIFTNGTVVDVDGSFTVSTADYFEFSDGVRFYSNLSDTSTLSMTEISGFGFLGDGSGIIAIDSSRTVSSEEKPASQNLYVNSDAILIDDVDLQARDIDIRMGDAAFGEIGIFDSLLESVEGGVFFQGGNIYSVESVITATGQGSEVSVMATSITLEGGAKESVIQSGSLTSSGGKIDLRAQNISLENNAKLISSSGGGRDGGDITLTGRTIQIENQSRIELVAGVNTVAGDLVITAEDMTIEDNSSLNTSGRFIGATAGDIDIEASGEFRIENDSQILAESDRTGAGGEVEIFAESIVIRDDSKININALGQGDSKFVDLQSQTNIIIDQGSIISASSLGGGDGGLVQIRGQDILLDDMSIQASANGEGMGGDIVIDANTVQITNNTTINVSSFSTAETAGSAGFVEITGDDITLDDNASFALASFGGGVGGEMRVVGSTINVDGVRIEAEAKSSGVGGDVEFAAGSINLSNTRIDASVRGSGLGGFIRLAGGAIELADTSINISAFGPGTAGDFFATGDSFTMTGSATSSGIFGDTRGDGFGADIFLSTDTVSLDGVAITSGTFGNGQGGIIAIDALTAITLNDALLTSESEGAGLGGDIDFRTSNFTMSGNTSVNVSSTGSGNAGRISVIPTENSTLTMAVSDTSNFALSARGDGLAGEFIAIANDVTFSDSSGIQASVQGAADGDLVSFNTTNLVIEDSATLTSDTRGSGLGGVIDINTTTLVLSDAASINAEALGSGDGGLVNINATTVTIDGGIINTSSQPQLDGSPATGTAGVLDIITTDLTLTNGAELRSDALSEGDGGDITIEATTLTLSGEKTSITAQAVGTGDGGFLKIDAKDIYLSDQASIKSDTLNSGDGGAVEITSINSLSVDGPLTRISAQAQGSGDGGQILISTDSFLLTNQASLQAEAFSTGEGGLILINATTVLVDNGTINTNSESTSGGPAATGDSGSLDIQATDVTLRNGAELRSDSLSEGDGGDITIATSNLSLSGRNTSISAQAAGAGDGGFIQVDARDISLTDNASIKSDSSLSGEGGYIQITGENKVSLAGNGTRISAQAGGSGVGGQILITTESFTLTDKASLVAEAFASGEGGLILIDAATVLIDDSTVNTNSLAAPGSPPATGNSGALGIRATEVTLNNGAQLRSDSLSEGHGGDIKIETNELSLNGENTSITAQTTGTGEGGFIQVDAREVALTDRASIKTDSLRSGEGGFIAINSTQSVSVEGAGTSISAKAGGSGIGGAILIITDSFSLTNEASLDAEAFSSGDGGLILIDAPTVLVDNSIINTNSQATPGNSPATGSAGALGISATNITLRNDAELRSDTLSEGLGGNIELEATTLTMTGQGTAITAQTAGTKDGGFIEINATSLALSDSASIKSDSLALGDGGQIDINVNTVTLDGNRTSITAQAAGSGDGGAIYITSDSLTLTDQASLNAEALSSGDGGLVFITSPTVLLDGAFINTNSQTRPTGPLTTGTSGTVDILADVITLANGASIRSDAFSAGDGGDINLEANQISLAGTRTSSEGRVINTSVTAETNGTGDGGTIRLRSPIITLSEKALINVSAIAGTGDAGTLEVLVDNLTLDDATIFGSTGGEGDGGSILVNDPDVLANPNIGTSIQLVNGSVISVSAFSDARPGSIVLDATDVLITDVSRVESDTRGALRAARDTGISIDGERLELSGNSTISSSSTGAADAGNISITLGDRLDIVGSAVNTTSAMAGGGIIFIDTKDTIFIDNGIVSATASGEILESGGGDVFIDPRIFTIRQSQIVAQANAGNGGNIDLVATNFVVDTETLISASSKKGIDGTVQIESPNQSVNPSSMILTTGFQDLPDFVSNNCDNPNENDRSYLVVENLNPIRRDPNDFLPVFEETTANVAVSLQSRDWPLAIWRRGC